MRSREKTSTPRPLESSHVITAMGNSEYQQAQYQPLEKPQIPSMTVVHSRSSNDPTVENYVVPPDTAPAYATEETVHTHPLGWER